MDGVDKLTLELFTNKTQYKKYLSKNDPVKYEIQEERKNKIGKYKKEILEKTTQLLYFPERSVSFLVQEMFDNFVDVIIKDIESTHLEINDYNNNDSGSEDEDEDEDVMFKNIDSKPTPIQIEPEPDNEKKTFWQSNTDHSYGVKPEGIFEHYPTNTSVRKRFIGRRNSIFP